MADINNIVDQLSALTVLEAAELAKALEEKWGVSAAAAVAAPAAAGAAAPAAEEKTEFGDRLLHEVVHLFWISHICGDSNSFPTKFPHFRGNSF